MYTTILSAVFILFAAISVLPGILKARKRFWLEAVSRIVIVVISAVISTLLTIFIAHLAGDKLVSPIASMINEDELHLSEILADVPSVGSLISILISLMITPIIFMLLFVIIKAIANKTAAIPLTKLFLIMFGKKEMIDEVYPPKSAEDEYVAELHFSKRSAIFGATCGLLAYFVLLVPAAGMMNLAGEVGKTVVKEGAPAYEICCAACDNIGTKAVCAVGTPINRPIMHYETDHEDVSIEKEAKFLAVFIKALGEMSSEDKEEVKQSANDFRTAGQLSSDTSLVPTVLADFVNAAAPYWLEGKSFHGITAPQIGGDPAMSAAILSALNGSTPEQMRSNLTTISNMMAMLNEKSASGEGSGGLGDILTDEKLLTDMSVEILNNEAFVPVLNEVVNSKLDEMDSQITLPEKDGETYNTLVTELITTYKANIHAGQSVTNEALNNLSTAVGNVLADQGVSLSDTDKKLVSMMLISNFGDGSTMTEESVSAFLEKYR